MVCMKAVAIDSQESNWDRFVESADDATSYHRFGWNTVITKSFGHRPHYLAAIDEQGEWQGVLPLVHMHSKLFGSFMISVPFVNYGGLLVRTEEAARLLLARAQELRRSLGAAHIELRHVGHGLDGLPTEQHKVTMILELATDEESQWKLFDAKLRNQIRKAQKSRLIPVVGHLELLEGFYEVFARNMRDLGTPVYTKEFFRNILQRFQDTTKIFAVYHGATMIAAGIGSWFRQTLEIPWASSFKEYKALCPNNMLYWEAIRFAIARGINKFDFGRSTPHEGTYNFKKQWGAMPVQLYWQYLIDRDKEIPHLNPSNPKYRSAINIWQKLPVPVTKLLGPLIVRNIP
jgi:FemAB-related protein (PEP-CTERM system-associated)